MTRIALNDVALRAVPLALLLAATLGAGTVAQAQEPPGPASPEHDRGWMTAGMGVGGPGLFPLALTANVGRTRVLQVGLRSHIRSLLFNNALTMASVSVGRSWVDRWTRTALTVGPAYVWSQGDRFESVSTVGLMLGGQAMATPIPEVGIGLDAYVNLNADEPAYGAAFVIVIDGNK
ncbi:MAG: hypothetical protein AAF089_13445 [Bacteroidota bacterium]